MARIAFCWFVLMATCLALPAQSIWIVDSAMGPGATFTRLPPAIAVAKAGDTILLRAGRYSTFDTSNPFSVVTVHRSLRILGVQSATVAGPIRVSNLPVGETVTLSNFRMVDAAPALPGALLRIENSRGLVHLERMKLYGSAWAAQPIAAQAGGVEVTDCAMVSMTACELIGGWPALDVRNSNVSVSFSRLTGGSAADAFGMVVGSGPALRTHSGLTFASRCVLQGGDGVFSGSRGALLPPSPAIDQLGGGTLLTGDGNSMVLAGGGTQPFSGTVAIRLAGTASTLVSPDIVVRGAGGAGVVWPSGTPAARFASVPSLAGQGAPPGGALQVDLFDVAGAQSVFLFGMPSPAPIVTPIASFWVDPAASFSISPGAISSNRYLTRSVKVPSLPSLLGITLAVQAAAISGQSFRVSNPLLLTLY